MTPLSTQDRQKAYDEYTLFEKRMQAHMDKVVYPSLDLTVKREGDYFHDLAVFDRYGKRHSIEEKFRARLWSDCAVEIMQDCSYSKPLRIGQLGWFYHSTADWIFYALARDFQADGPSKVYKIYLNKLRAGMPGLIEGGANTKEIISVKGKGISINLGFDWEILILNEIAEQVY